MQKIIFYCCISLLSYQSVAQSFAFRNFSIAEGLPSAEVYDVLQDSQGFIWFATDNGVVKFDGHEMTVFRVADGLEDPVVFGIQEDQRGRVWFRTFSRNLFFYENGKIHPYRFNNVLVNAPTKGVISSMHIDSLEEVWFYAVPLRGHITATGELHADTLARGTLFCKNFEHGYINGVWPSRGISSTIDIDGTPYPIEYNFLEKYSLNISAVKWRNKLYLTGNNHIFEFDGASVKKVFTGKAPIIYMYKDPADYLWVGYEDGGLERFSSDGFEDSWTLDFLKTKSVSNILKDKEGGVWITTLQSGVFYYPDPSIELYDYSDQSKLKSITATDNEVITGAYSGTVTVFDAKLKKESASKKFDRPILSLLKDSRNNLWVYAKGLYLLDKNLKELVFAQHTPTLEFAEDKNGDVWGLGSNGYKFDREGNVLLFSRFKPRFRNMLFADSLFYISEQLGLQVCDTAFTLLEKPESLAKMKISKILSLNDSTLFVGTIGNGFLLVNKFNWRSRQFNSQEQFIADNIYTAVKTDTTIWMGTEKGVLIMDLQKLLNGELSFNRLTKASGLVSDKINFLGITKYGAWAFSDEGISTIPYQNANVKDNIPKFYFKKILVNSKQVEISSASFTSIEHDGPMLTMPYDSTNVMINLGFLSLRNQDIISRYRLTKNDPWVYTNDRTLQFSALGPGEYHFELEYSVDNFQWIPAFSIIDFKVTPPWWQRWYVQISAFLILGMLVYLYFRNHYRTLRKHQQKLIQAEIETLERERNRIAKELHDGVATNLSAIKLMVSQLLRTHNDPMAEDLDEQFLSTITEIKDIIYGLTPPGLERHGLFIGLKNYIEKLNKAIPVKIQLDLVGNEINHAELGILTFRIIQELLSNSVRHASAKNISIKLNSENGALNILFQDDGIGFSYDPGKSGLGLANVESRIESINGTMKFESRLSGNTGCSYNISLPIR